MPGVAAVTKRVNDVEKEVGELLIEVESQIPPGKRAEFAHQVELMLLNSSVNLIELFSKEAKVRTAYNSHEVDRKWRDLRAKSEVLRRRSQLLGYSTLEDCEAALMWMAEQGVEDDLYLLREVKGSLPHASENLSQLFAIAEQRISERVSNSVK